MKIDNSNLADKLGLRRYFLDRYHKGREIKVFDACQGRQVLWGILRKEYSCRYWGVDTKKKKGRLKVNSERVLAEAGWDFDVIDVDTYGQPWRHWESIIKNGSRDVTVFLTIGMVAVGGGRKHTKRNERCHLPEVRIDAKASPGAVCEVFRTYHHCHVVPRKRIRLANSGGNDNRRDQEREVRGNQA